MIGWSPKPKRKSRRRLQPKSATSRMTEKKMKVEHARELEIGIEVTIESNKEPIKEETKGQESPTQENKIEVSVESQREEGQSQTEIIGESWSLWKGVI